MLTNHTITIHSNQLHEPDVTIVIVGVGTDFPYVQSCSTDISILQTLLVELAQVVANMKLSEKE